MTHLEAFELLKGSYWVTGTCQTGEECWCREILPASPLFDDNGDELYVVGPGSISKNKAEYIVKLHNARLDGLLFDDHNAVIDYVFGLKSFPDMATDYLQDDLGKLVFDRNDDAVEYVEYELDNLVFDSDKNVIEYVLDNNLIDVIADDNFTIDSMYREAVINKINELSESIGFAKILEKLEQ